MCDLNKYLETQLALASRKKNKLPDGVSNISERSKVAAELISKKEKDIFNRKKNKRIDAEIEKTINRKDKKCDSESEYQPSTDDEEDKVNLKSCSTRSNKTLNKIIDDGDKDLYHRRIEAWKENLKAAQAGSEVKGSLSADVQYILDGNHDIQAKHITNSGLCSPYYIWKQLYKYQRTGVKWLWELHLSQSGGLLGDEMGLGKTVQLIAFLAGLSNTDSGSWGGLGPSIIVAPATLVYQWVSHFHFWYPSLRVAVLHSSGSFVGNCNKLIRDIHDSHGVLLITYAGIVKYSKDLQIHRWHYLILDEGHKIRNPDTQVCKYTKKFQTPHRILITGSPMQNSLQELWSLFDFIRPGLLGTHNAFMEHFANPITQGGYANATELQETTALEMAKALKSMITPYLLRRTKAEVQDHIKLPEKKEQVLFCALSQEQRDLYMGYLMGSTVRSILDKENKYGDPFRARILVALSTLRKICNHPDLYLYEVQEDESHVLNSNFGHWKRCGKMVVVNSLLKIWQKQGHRALIFSQSRAMLCVLEQYLQDQNFNYLKMDGAVTVSQRQNLIKTFNENSEYLVFLSTTRVGGLGVNLTGADRVIIYDPDWNPATDNQAKERAWRIGQERNVTVYRLLSAGTIEEKIYQRQIFKNFLSNKILIAPNQKNILTTSTLQGLFTLEEPNREGDTETASLFKHTKVTTGTKDTTSCKETKKRELSLLNKKVEAMKRKAKEISKKIANTVGKPKEDPREAYRKKREQLLNPPVVEEPEINTVDDKVTTATFEDIMSELDIINMHAKDNYEQKLIEDVLNKESEKDNDAVETDEAKEPTNLDNNEELLQNKALLENNFPKDFDESHIAKKNEIHSSKNKSKKRGRDSDSDEEIECLLSVKKVKKKKMKEKKGDKTDEDDYVLNKLFAKASVKSALHHDAVVGLSEKEKKYRMQEEAQKKTKKALRAIKFSCKS